MKNKQIVALISLAMKITFAQLLLVILFVCNAYATKGQDIFNKKVSISAKNIKLKKVLVQLENLADIKFVYSSRAISADKPVSISAKEALLSDVLNKIFEPFSIKYKVIDGAILLYKDSADGNAGQLQYINDLSNNNDTTRRRISGTVTDQNGAPLINASIVIVGTPKGTFTDAQGKFNLTVDDNDNIVIEISHIGYSTSSFSIGAKTDFQVALKESANGMNEVVVVGYQTQKRGNVTGAVSIIDVGDIAKQPIGFVDQALQGKAAGVRVTQATGQPGDGVSIRIRGVGTINNNDPLFIIDGVPTKDGLNFLSANDIASITVLKDAASAAIYGARSANGVVVITTKNGTKSGKVNINYNGYYGIQTHGTLTKMVDAQEYKTLYNEMANNDNAIITNPVLKRPLIADSVPMANTNWLEDIFQTAPIQNHALTISGGNDKTQYYVSGNLFKQDGIILNSWYDRYTLHSKVNMQPTDKLNVGVNINLSYYDKNSIGSSGDGTGGNGGSVVRYALFRDPAIPLYNPDGSYSDLPNDSKFFGDGYNPVALAVYTQNGEKQYRTFGDIFIDYKLAKTLHFKTDFGGDVFVTEDKTFNRNYGTFLRVNSPNTLVEDNITSTNMVWNNTFRFNKIFNGVHNISAFAGTEAVSNSTLETTASDRGFPIQIPSLEYLGGGTGVQVKPVETLNEWALFSLIGNINYDYRSLLFASFSYRRDGSSRFGPNNQYANFSAGSVGWNLNNEKWFQKVFPTISKTKLRASFGQLGNQDISDYPAASIISSGYNAVFGSPPAVEQGYALSTRGNNNVKWEASTQIDGGLDIGVWNDRLTFSADYFVKKTTDMLVEVPLPLIGGTAYAPYQNNGSVQNQGLELELTYRNNNSSKFKYTINANFATLQNKVTALANNSSIQGGRIDNNVYATLTAVGHPIGSFYGYQMEGIFQNAAEIFKHAYQGPGVRPGDVMYKDINGDGVIDQNDRTFLGSAIPKFTYGLTGDFEYQNFDLSLFFQGAYGNKIYLQVNQDIEGFYRPFNLTQRVYDQRWHGEGTSNTMPLVSWSDAANNILEPSSRFLEDASYLRLKNIQLGYTIPKRITDRMHIKGLRFYVSSQNLLTITKYTGLDPEMQTSNNVKVEKYPGDVAAGIDWGTYPSAKNYIVGVNLNF